jgi:adenylate cyclase
MGDDKNLKNGSLIPSVKREIIKYPSRLISRGLELIKKMGKCDLLIVDDEPSYRLSLEQYFRLNIPGVKIKLAKDGEEAYNLALKFKPRIIWTCIKMPLFSGLELIELIRKNSDIQNTNIIVYTAYHSGKNQAFALGADAYLHKGEYGQLEEGLKIVTNFLK